MSALLDRAGGDRGDTESAGRAIVVMHTLRPPDGTTKYVDQMVGAAAAAPGTAIRFFSWTAALRGGYDVLHVHWPELLVRSRRPWRRLGRRRALALLLVLLRWRRVPIVWTAHNTEPHEVWSAAESVSVRRLLDAVTLVVRLTPATRVEAGHAVVTIPHGHYRTPFAQWPAPSRRQGRVLYFGIIRPYKGVDRLLRAFEATPGGDLALRIVGDPHPGQRDVVGAAESRDARISSILRFVDDQELVSEIGQAQLVVLPYRGTMGNSGAILAALSVGRPVLVPRSEVNDLLAAEVGERWIIRYDGDLTPDVLARAIADSAEPGTPPSLAGRDWPSIGRDHRAAYLRAIELQGAK